MNNLEEGHYRHNAYQYAWVLIYIRHIEQIDRLVDMKDLLFYRLDTLLMKKKSFEMNTNTFLFVFCIKK